LGLPDLVWAISAARVRRGDEKAPALLGEMQEASDNAVLEAIFGSDSDAGLLDSPILRAGMSVERWPEMAERWLKRS
jgi:hypothetical protein